MRLSYPRRIALTVIAIGGLAAFPALAQKSGGILKLAHRDTPPSVSIHEEATVSVNAPMMAVFNNLVVYDQHKPINSSETIVPELAESWSWSQDAKTLTFKLRQGVQWHDGKPFTAEDVKCTWDMLTEKGKQKFRKNPRESWYANLKEVKVDGPYEVSFHLERPQPAMLDLLAGGYSPVYPCHVPPAQMRTKPIGTGPFKFVEFKQNEYIRLTKNPNYWKQGKPYLDGVEWTIVRSRSTRVLGFIAGEFDMTFPVDITVPLLKDIQSQRPQATCEMQPTNVSTNLLVNRKAPPFDNPKILKAMMLTIDRQAFIDILSEGQSDMGGAMLPPPEGQWGLPKERLAKLPGYSPDVKKSREEARKLMQEAGYGPDKRLPVKVSTRNIEVYRDPAVILIDHLKEIYIDGELDIIDTSQWYGRIARNEFSVGLNLTGSSLDEPDANFFENYACNSERNYTKYCNPELEKKMIAQSQELDRNKRREMVWDIDEQLQLDGARPMILHSRGATCWQPHVKNVTMHRNSIYNGWRWEDIWLDK
jgi:peptide/nickel transport system substrate-binding protein